MIKEIFVLYLFFVYSIISGHDLNEHFLLCKICGHEVAHLKDVIYKKSPLATKTWNDTKLFHNNVIKIQRLKNPQNNEFDLITVTRADLNLLNETRSISDTWFPNYYWTICLCPKCFTHIGWYFNTKSGQNDFFTLILDKLFNEETEDSIILKPKLKLYQG